MRKKKTALPGGIPLTPRLRYLQKNNYFEFIREYQRRILEIKAAGI